MNKTIIFILSFCLLSITSIAEVGSNFPTSSKQKKADSYGSIFGSNGLQLFGGGNKAAKQEIQNTPTTNAFLWHAALDVIQFMPLASTDHSGGVINTDWYDDKELKDVMYKVNIVIKSSQLNATSLHVSVFKRKFQDGRWRDQKTSTDLAIQLEDKILAKARELKVRQEETQ